MFTSMDLLIIVVMALAAASLLTMALMFLVKNERVRRVCMYMVSALAVYIGYVGIRIHFPGFMAQVLLAGVLALTAIGAVVLQLLKKNDGKMFLVSRILAAAALAVGMVNAFVL